eukprot:EG_transcript_23869
MLAVSNNLATLLASQSLQQLQRGAVTVGLVLTVVLNFREGLMLQVLRVSFVVAQVSLFLTLVHIFHSIRTKADRTMLEVPLPLPKGAPVDSPFATETTSTEQYDLDELRLILTSGFAIAVICCLLYLMGGYTAPLFVAVWLNSAQILLNPLGLIHVLDFPAEGELKRPWTIRHPVKVLRELINAQTQPAPAPEKRRRKGKKSS